MQFSKNNVVRANLLSFTHSGDKGIRTLDPLLARQVLSQLSYTPIQKSAGQWIFAPYRSLSQLITSFIGS